MTITTRAEPPVAVAITPSHAAPAARAAAAAIASLEQCAGFLRGVSDRAYTTPCLAMTSSTIGQHVRHAIDHFTAAVGGARDGVIDYDHRRRDTPVENNRSLGLQSIADTIRSIASLAGSIDDHPVVVRIMLNAEGEEADLGSTLGRELAFAAHHALHHHSMMAAIARDLGLPVPVGFGKAPATLNHEGAAR